MEERKRWLLPCAGTSTVFFAPAIALYTATPPGPPTLVVSVVRTRFTVVTLSSSVVSAV